MPQPVTTILTFALTGDVDEAALREAGSRIERTCWLAADGISTVRLRGVRALEISISVSEGACASMASPSRKSPTPCAQRPSICRRRNPHAGGRHSVAHQRPARDRRRI
ncbi:MAG: hypothetical protein JKP95_00870 [Oceanicaulis sp.]|nr:hypothetical protein [Oceanicaulis sp.]